LTSRSLSLQAFAIDSIIELVAGGVLLRRLVLEWRARRRLVAADEKRIERAERRASRLVGWALYALALYVVLNAALSLLAHSRAESAPAGIVLAAAALVIMPALAFAKRRVAEAIGSVALRADAACSLVCAYMSATLLAGLGLTALFDWWWADALAALALLWCIVREGREALEKAAGPDAGCP